MPRIPYRDEDDPKVADVVRIIRERRGGKLLNLDRMLIHSPNFARGWNSLLGAVRRELTLDAKSRELAICAVAKINKADYEWDHHVPHLLAAGATQQQVDALNAGLDEASDDAALFDEKCRAALRLSIEMTRYVEVRPETLERARKAFGDKTLVDLVGTIAAYNMVSRFLVALGVEDE
jgi:AhpD family alkylhydroperoxidase